MAAFIDLPGVLPSLDWKLLKRRKEGEPISEGQLYAPVTHYSHFISIMLRGGFYYPHFTDEEIEAQGG